ncbi:hypothetical protein RIF25_16355 [Thermosynechococcaceae cyanobacterium BACA0444]|uniref:Uncharacterized protein n=1 Tax=Pseudocalidococcus azoricus BACA0444 TaxID=2918990 RepID=A0AAE4FVM8_9CYAN|nr:hypothetical protein [Pseudocalidococcus azoricus]MDS3862372.1 hypothetical protein [Pseudocalidococcus azoricus BACA0444]
MKYFFLSEGWEVGRVWEPAGIWNLAVWRRQPLIEQTALVVIEQDERLCLYQVEEAVLMVEVKPGPGLVNHSGQQGIGQVVLKRLMTAEQVLTYLISHGGIEKIEQLALTPNSAEMSLIP